MHTSLTAALVSACLLAAVWIGMWLRRLLPEHHLSPDSRDTVKLAMGLVATMSALLLGLLVSSAKTSYDTMRGQVIQMASKVALLDRVLGVYGPEGAELRRQMRSLIEEQMRRMWPGERTAPTQARPQAQSGDAFYVAIQTLSARDDTQRALKAQAVSLTLEVAQLRSLMLAQSTSSISMPMLTVVVLWLVVIFLSFSLLAPPNATANLALMVSALCTAGALFLVLELDRPFGGLIQISSEPLRNVLSQLGKWGLKL
jgi:hypothetical protein